MRQSGLSVLLFLCLSFSFEAQSQKIFFSDNYANYRWKGDSLFRLKNFEQALAFYKKALSEPSKERFKRYCYYNSFICNANLKKSKEAYFFYKKGVRKGLRYYSKEAFEMDTLLYEFRSNKGWCRVKKRVFKNISKYSKIDTATLNILNICYKRDQFWRDRSNNHIESLKEKYSPESIDSLIYHQMAKSDIENQKSLKKIFERKEWVGLKEVGNDGDQAAWLIVQHADNDLVFQEFCLKLIEKAIIKDNTRLISYPYLIDRILINKDLKQIYGTQFEEVIINGKKKLKAKSLENENFVDKYRNCFGLESISDYLQYASKRYNLE